jgi:hypothetical protein
MVSLLNFIGNAREDLYEDQSDLALRVHDRAHDVPFVFGREVVAVVPAEAARFFRAIEMVHVRASLDAYED